MSKVFLAALVAALAVPALAASSSPQSGFYGCRTYTSKHPVAVVRPHSIVVACADGNFYLTRLSWTSWAAAKAVAAGTGHQNDCTPNCAAGHFHTYPADVSLTKPRTCAGHKVFTTLSWRFTKPTPKGIALSGATTFSC
ncbi:MAG TPA: hypothetical protein VFA97_01285 [Gaiellaceae bacterium]|nr:hypothetical protein [Gaiellaceae bacterium]